MLRNVKGFQSVLLWLCLFKFSYIAIICSALHFWPGFNEEKLRWVNVAWFYKIGIEPPKEMEAPFLRHFATWDAEHYLYLSELGYSKDLPSCAFFPLWPFVIRWLSVVTGGSHVIAGMILANIFSLAAWMIFYTVVAARFGEKIAFWSLALIVIFPGSLFYQFIYTEPLFFLLVMLLWAGLQRNQYTVAWIAAFLLPLSRAVGVFCILPVMGHFLMQSNCVRVKLLQLLCLCGQREARNIDAKPANSQWQLYALLAAPPLGLALYFMLMRAWTGNPLEGIEAQRYWGAHSLGNLWNLPKFLIGLVEPTSWHGFSGSVLDRCAFMVLVYCLPLIWRLGKDLVVWTYVLGILPAMSGTFVSFIRFESTAFPVFIALALYFNRIKSKWLLFFLVTTTIILHGILVWRFVNFRWAG